MLGPIAGVGCVWTDHRLQQLQHGTLRQVAGEGQDGLLPMQEYDQVPGLWGEGHGLGP